MNILIVEPSNSFSKIIESIFNISKVSTSIAHSGAAAISLLKESKPNAICVAHELGDMNSFEFIEYLNHSDIYPRIPKFLITSNKSNELRKKSYDAGYTDIFFKSHSSSLNKVIQSIMLNTSCHINARILYIEDVPSTAQYTIGIMKNVGWDITHVEKGEDALEVLKKDDNYDLIITDLILSGTISGMSLINSIREQDYERAGPIPIIAVSGWNDITRQVVVLQQGACDFISKPFDETDFLARALILIQKKKLIYASHEEKEFLTSIAHYDALTNLPNRTLLVDRLQQAISSTQRNKKKLAVVFIDLDGFKSINDTHGHNAGDKLLMTVASRMKEAMRETDTLSRIGGDEFVGVLTDFDEIQESNILLHRMLETASKPVHSENIILQVSASMGVTYYPQDKEVTPEVLINQADKSMYMAKLAGKNQFSIFDSNNDQELVETQLELSEINSALNNDEFTLYFQPNVNMKTGKILGVESQLYWQHPKKGLLKPAEFLPHLKRNSIEIKLGEYLINKAFKQLSIWSQSGKSLSLSVKLGSLYIQHPEFIDNLNNLIQKYPNVKPEYFEIEILEVSALEDIYNTSKIINSCRKLGISFTLDSFGSGYSSLTYLKLLPAEKLKIDGEFIKNMLHSPDELSIIEGTLGLARAFHLKVIADGVESLAQGKLLLKQGCEIAQGSYIAQSMHAEDLDDWMNNWKPEPKWMNETAISHDDLPLLFAEVDHQAWIKAIKDYLHNNINNNLPPLDMKLCRFGKWLDHEGKTRYGKHESFKQIEHLHEQVHLLAIEIIEKHSSVLPSVTNNKLYQLDDLKEKLLKNLDTLIKK